MEKIEEKEWQEIIDVLNYVLSIGKKNLFWTFLVILGLLVYQYIDKN